MIRLVATDLDGTLLGPDMVVPEQHTRAIEELARRGVTVLAATSRRPRVVRPLLRQAGLAIPAVLMDGALGIDFRSEDRFHEAVFEPDAAVSALSIFRRSGLEPCVYVEDQKLDVLVSETPSTCAAHLADLGELAGVEDLDHAVLARPVYAFSVLGVGPERLEQAADLLRSNGTQVVVFAEARYGQFGLTANPQGVSKWSGIEAYCRMTGIAKSEVLAVGDGDNDVEMLTNAAIAVAVSGGTEQVMALADHVINPPSEHGWVSVLDLVAWAS